MQKQPSHLEKIKTKKTKKKNKVQEEKLPHLQ